MSSPFAPEILRNTVVRGTLRAVETTWGDTNRLTIQELQIKLWQIADILRGQIDSADDKDYIFSILLLKRLSDRFDEEVETAVNDRGVPRETALADRDEHEFFLPEGARWSVITAQSMGLGEGLNVASFAVEDANTGRLDGVLTGVNWNDEQELGGPANREALIRQLLNPLTSATPTSTTAKWTQAACWATPTSTSSISSPTTPARRAVSSTPLAR